MTKPQGAKRHGRKTRSSKAKLEKKVGESSDASQAVEVPTTENPTLEESAESHNDPPVPSQETKEETARTNTKTTKEAEQNTSTGPIAVATEDTLDIVTEECQPLKSDKEIIGPPAAKVARFLEPSETENDEYLHMPIIEVVGHELRRKEAVSSEAKNKAASQGVADDKKEKTNKTDEAPVNSDTNISDEPSAVPESVETDKDVVLENELLVEDNEDNIADESDIIVLDALDDTKDVEETKPDQDKEEQFEAAEIPSAILGKSEHQNVDIDEKVKQNIEEKALENKDTKKAESDKDKEDSKKQDTKTVASDKDKEDAEKIDTVEADSDKDKEDAEKIDTVEADSDKNKEDAEKIDKVEESAATKTEVATIDEASVSPLGPLIMDQAE